MLAYLRFIQAVERRAWSRCKGRLYHGLVDFVLREGRAWTPARLPEGVRAGEPRHCYRNSFELAFCRGLTYVEGYACDVLPVLHAWCVDGEGRVIDNTWDGPERCVYFGVAFDPGYVRRTVMGQRIYGLIDLPETGWPLVTGRHVDWRHRGWSSADLGVAPTGCRQGVSGVRGASRGRVDHGPD